MVAKPLHSLGLLEDAVVKIAGITGTADVTLGRRAVLMMCADNGVVAEGVTQTGQEVTAIVAENAAKGDSSVCRMARISGADVVAVDVGIARPVNNAVLNRNIRRGTRNIAAEPAMTEEEAGAALQTGIDLVRQKKAEGYGLFALGEMGIGNTTPSTAIFAVLGDVDPEEITGVGANLSEDLTKNKAQVIRDAIALNKPDKNDPVDILSKVGGLEIAAMTGVMLAGAACHVPVVVDGYISTASAAIAIALKPEVKDYLICSHASDEKGAKFGSELLDFAPFLHMDMRLGEGSGAALAFYLLDAAVAMNRDMATYADVNMDVV